MLPKINGYSIKEKIHSGRFTTIYRAETVGDAKPVVLKILNDEFPSRLQRAKLKHEFDIGFSLKTIKGVIQYLDLILEGSKPTIVLEDFGGISLRQIIDKSRLSILEILDIGEKLGQILGEIHSKGIIHKDINPNNIIINQTTAEIKLIDFEISTNLKQEKQLLEAADHLEGTLPYISPEQTGRMNRLVDYRSDLYSLGITLYEMFAERLPFISNDNMELVHAHIARMAEPLSLINTNIIPPISDVVQRLMAKAAEDRYKTGFGLKRDLDICAEIVESGEKIYKFTVGQNDTSGIFTIPAKLYGREVQLSKLYNTFEQVKKGAFEMLLVTGSPGIGKSSLINEIQQPITESRGFFIAGKFDQFKRNIPYSALIVAFQDFIRQLLTESNDKLARWKKDFESALGQSASVLINLVPTLELVIGPQPAVPDLGPHESQNRLIFLFQKFLAVISKEEHPLVLFLDDCQWADSPSLNLLESVIKSSETKHILLIAAYRDNEVTSGHPLQLSLDRISGSGIQPQEIVISSLAKEDVSLLLSEALYGKGSDLADRSEIVKLADHIFRKTNGNPFFVNQFLKTLHDDSLISFDNKQNTWTWNLVAINKLGNTSNVLEFMVSSIAKLPEETQKLLKLAACIGNQFHLTELVTVSSKSESEISSIIQPALINELLQPIGNVYKFLPKVDESDMPSLKNSDNQLEEFQIAYRFVHDRIQQAAYSMLNETESQNLHYNIGQLIFNNTPTEILDEKIFDITSHLNKGINFIQDSLVKENLSRLNLRASIKARESVAYEPALQHIAVAMKLLQELKVTDPLLIFNLHLERAECEHLTGKDDVAEEFYKQSLELAPSRDEKTLAFEKMIHFYTNRSRFKDAYETGRRALKLLNVYIPPAFIPPLFIGTLIKTKWRLRNKRIADLINMPVCENPDIIKSMALLAAILKAAYQIKPQLCIHNAMIALNLTLSHGAIPDATIAYLVYGAIFVGSVMSNHEEGHAFGKLALAMVDKFNHLKQKAEVNFVYGYFANSWTYAASNTEQYYRAAYEIGLQTGDFFHVACSSCTLMESHLIRGVPLDDIESASAKLLDLMHQIDNKESAGAIEAVRGIIRNLQGKTTDYKSFGNSDFDEIAYVEEIKAYTSLHFSHFYFINKMQTLYLWGFIDDAIKLAKESRTYLQYSVGMLHTTEHFFYEGLIAASGYTKFRKMSYLRTLKKCIKKFKVWQQENPDNFLHKYLLLSAELARVTGKSSRATGLYGQAILRAKEEQYIQNVAIANELAGRFHLLEKNQDIAFMYLRTAIIAYEKWGATAKFQALEREFPNSSVERASRTVSTINTKKTNTTSESIIKSLDLSTILKSTQAISSEILLGNLLEKMITIAIENAGAQRGVLLLEKEENFYIEADGKVDGTKEILQSISMDNEKLPITILNYVIRTTQSIVIADGLKDNRFNKDIFITNNQVRSILCMPIIGQGKINGILYLENNLITNAFTTDRLELLKVLASQASISIENARLYNSLEQKVEERTKELNVALAVVHDQKIQVESTLEELKETQEQLIHAEKFAALGQLVAGVAHEINNPIGAIQASAERIEDELEFGKREFPEYFRNLQEHEIPIFNELLDRSLSNKVILTTKEERNRKKIIKQSLESLEFSSSDKRSLALEYLSNLGITDRLDTYFTVMKEDKFLKTINIVDRFVSQNKSLRNIYISVEKASKVVFALRKFLNTNIKTEKKTISIREELEKVIKVYDNYINGFIEVSFEIREDVKLTCLADEMSQVWRNIIFNSIQAMYSTEKNLKITLECERDSDNSEKKMAIVKISDTGMGMTQEIKEKVYTPFFTTKPAGEGIGLGLFISRRIIEEHGGEITFTSEVGNTEFVVRIPI